MPGKHLTSELMEILVHHNWKGNVRELYNCVQYMAYLGDEILDVNNLPPNFKSETDPKKQKNNGAELTFGNFYYDEERELSMLVLECLLNRNIGRKQIVDRLKTQGKTVSEYRIRAIIKKLKESGYIEYKKGRAGAELTALGYALVKMDKIQSKNGRKQ